MNNILVVRDLGCSKYVTPAGGRRPEAGGRPSRIGLHVCVTYPPEQTHTHTHTYIHTRIHKVHVRIYAHTCTRTHTHISTGARSHTHTHTRTDRYIFNHVQPARACTHTHIRAHIQTGALSPIFAHTHIHTTHLISDRQHMTVPSNVEVDDIKLVLRAELIGNTSKRGAASLWYSVIDKYQVIFFTQIRRAIL